MPWHRLECFWQQPAQGLDVADAVLEADHRRALLAWRAISFAAASVPVLLTHKAMMSAPASAAGPVSRSRSGPARSWTLPAVDDR